jgi:hypothetical protein
MRSLKPARRPAISTRDHIIAESAPNGAAQREYIWLDDVPVAVVDQVAIAPVIYYVHTDHLFRQLYT